MFGLSKYAIAGLLVVIVVLGGVAQWQRSKIVSLVDENASLTRSVNALLVQKEQSDLARDVERARSKLEAKRNVALVAQIETILTGGIPDAILHPDLAAIFNGGNVQPD